MKITLRFSVIALGLLFLAANGVHSQSLATSSQRIIFDSSAFTGTSTPLPNWSNGYLVSRETETFQQSEPNIRWYDGSGKQSGSASIWFPGTQRLRIYAAVAAADGTIIAGGKSEKADGANGPFIAKIDSSGRTQSVIQTQGFFPENICAAPDGTVWSFGGTGFDVNNNPIDGNTIRHFDFKKGELGSYLPRSLFPKRPAPEILAGMSCGADSLAIYSSKTSQLVTLKYGDTLPHVYSVKTPSGLKVTGFAISGTSIYASISQAGKGGLYLLSVNVSSQSAEWVPLTGTAGSLTGPGVVTALWGADNRGNLIISKSDDAATALYWASPMQ